MLVDILLVVAKIVFVLFLFALPLGGFLTWVERKQSAVMQDRIGANRATLHVGPFKLRLLGLFHIITDALKMFAKEDYIPDGANRTLFTLAPFIAIFFGLMSFGVIPFGDSINILGRDVSLSIANLDSGLLYVFAMLSMGLYALVLAGWSSDNNWAIIGGLRASALMISYEIAIGISLIGIVMVYQTLNLNEIVRGQGAMLFGVLPKWGILTQPLGFLLFITAGVAATKRVPFDHPEGESEIIGYFVEYSGMKFGMFMMADFLETVVIASLTTTLFLGGWQIPYVDMSLLAPWTAVILQVVSFSVKVLFMIFILMTIRWTLPRFRYDQAMRLGWLNLLPLALLNVFLTGLITLVI